jgi:hypothetical protein
VDNRKNSKNQNNWFMNTGPFTLKSFLTNHNLEQLIVPEIQRDYVWKPGNALKLVQSIYDDSQKSLESQAEAAEDTIRNLPPDLRDLLLKGLEDQKISTHVGFIYAYHNDDFNGRYMLIDGQQRITTLFLLLLALHIDDNTQDIFKRTYFKEGLLKFDYRVRQTAHDFMTRLVDYLLEGGALTEVKNQYWYYADYEHDKTIAAILSNYAAIEEFIATHDLSLQYVEDSVELLYFDTHKTEQGEELYLYMNSRGVSVSNNENIKAQLLENLSAKDKDFWGTQWEHWQSIFWKLRGNNPNADLGFDEFLRWLKMIKLVRSKPKSTVSRLFQRVRDVKESKKFGVEGLDKEEIAAFMSALERLLKHDSDWPIFDEVWLSKEINAIDYIRILPLLLYARHFEDATQNQLTRVARYFRNVIRFENVSKTPYSSIVTALRLAECMVAESDPDIAVIRVLGEIDEFKNFLTSGEIAKFELYHKSETEEDRNGIETSFWSAEDDKYLFGSIQLICRASEQSLAIADIDQFDIDIFDESWEHYQMLFNRPSDLLRRALLTKGDYSFRDGFTPSLGGERYSFLFLQEDWRWVVSDSNISAFVVALLIDFSNRASASDLTADEILNEIISDYLASETGKEMSWRNVFISNPGVLAYCQEKKVCFVDTTVDKIYLLMNKNAVTWNYKQLDSFIN